MNRIERLASGEVPLLNYLRNVSLLLSGTTQHAAVAAALNEIEHRSSGAPRLDPAQMPEVQEKIIHVNDMVPFAFMEQGWQAGAAVLRLRVPRYEAGQPRLLNGNPTIYLGTGWLLTSSLVMTNHHVINARNEGEPAASDADLNLQVQKTSGVLDFNAENLSGTAVQVQSLEAWESVLDYAILRVLPTGRPPLRLATARIQKGPDPIPVNIIQHPGGREKRYAIRNNLISASTETQLRYFTDTEGGSSGSPVFNDRWEVVGLHRAATPVTNVQFQGKDTAYINVGTPIPAILADLRVRFPVLWTEIGL